MICPPCRCLLTDAFCLYIPLFCTWTLLYKRCIVNKNYMIRFVKFQDRPEILINKRKNQIHIICREISHYYRALNYTIHHMEEDEFQYQEHVCFERNGLMLDCSRNAVFTVEKVKFLIRTLAKLGMNVLMPYTEDTYEVAGNG